MDDPQVVRPQPKYRMPDLPMKTQSAPLHAVQLPRTQTHAPQISTAQRRANQAGQPRDGVGQYAKKTASKWEQLSSSSGSNPVASTSLKRQKTPARPAPRRATAAVARPVPQQKKRKAAPLPSMAAMIDRPLHHKVGYVVRRWFRRKKRHFKALFSLRG